MLHFTTMKQIALTFAILAVGCVSSNYLVNRQDCVGQNCNELRAKIMKYVILKFNFNEMYTDYLTRVTNCLCNSTDPCIGTVYNTCINEPVGRKESCAFSFFLLIDFYILKTKQSDFNCFNSEDLLEYQGCVCSGAVDACPGTKHNECFQSIFG